MSGASGPRADAARVAWLCASAALVALIVLGLAWEMWLAPLRPGGSWLVLKVVPLLLPLPGILHGRRYTFQWSALAIWPWFVEGAVRAWSDPGPSARLALVEAALALAFVAAAVAYSRSTRPA